MSKALTSIVAVASLLSTSCSLSNRYPYYYEFIVESPPLTTIDLYAWVDDRGDWMTGINVYHSCLANLNLLAVYTMQQDYPCPLKDMAKMIERSGKDPSYIDLTILPYPIATEYDLLRMDRIGNYENWYVYLSTELGLLNEHSVDAESMEDYLGHSYESERGLNI